MKILHLPSAFFPWVTGGKEVYVLHLASALKNLNTENFIAFHQQTHIKETLGENHIEGLPVIVLPPIPIQDENWSRFTREYDDLPGFSELLDRIQPDVVHFHDHLGGASLTHLKMVKKRGIKAVYTYHTPGQSCLQSALRYKNKLICDGKLLQIRCTECRLTSAGYPGMISKMLSLSPIPAQKKLAKNRMWRALAGRSMTKVFIDSFREQVELVDKIHVHANWVEEMMILNNVPSDKLFLSKTASGNTNLKPLYKKFEEGSIIDMAFVGRAKDIKGIHVLIDAFSLLPKSLPVKVHFFGPYWEGEYGKNQWNRVKDDKRFLKPQLVSPNDLGSYLNSMDVMLVPSIWLETGPLSVLDSFNAGVPVIGSDLGGTSELVTHEVDGYLVAPESAELLADAIQKVVDEPEIVNKWKKNIKPQRSMNDMGKDMVNMYNEIFRK